MALSLVRQPGLYVPLLVLHIVFSSQAYSILLLATAGAEL